MKVFSCEVSLCATAYIKAENEAEAKAKFFANFGTLTKSENIEDVRDTVSDARLDGDEEDFPEISLSPCMASYGPYDPKNLIMDEQHDYDDDSELLAEARGS